MFNFTVVAFALFQLSHYSPFQMILKRQMHFELCITISSHGRFLAQFVGLGWWPQLWIPLFELYSVWIISN